MAIRDSRIQIQMCGATEPVPAEGIQGDVCDHLDLYESVDAGRTFQWLAQTAKAQPFPAGLLMADYTRGALPVALDQAGRVMYRGGALAADLSGIANGRSLVVSRAVLREDWVVVEWREAASDAVYGRYLSVFDSATAQPIRTWALGSSSIRGWFDDRWVLGTFVEHSGEGQPSDPNERRDATPALFDVFLGRVALISNSWASPRSISYQTNVYAIALLPEVP